MACAMGCAIVAEKGVLTEDTSGIHTTYPELQTIIQGPCTCGGSKEDHYQHIRGGHIDGCLALTRAQVSDHIMSVNDGQDWSVERVAKWLEPLYENGTLPQSCYSAQELSDWAVFQNPLWDELHQVDGQGGFAVSFELETKDRVLVFGDEGYQGPDEEDADEGVNATWNRLEG
jgi:hypothetical protein